MLLRVLQLAALWNTAAIRYEKPSTSRKSNRHWIPEKSIDSVSWHWESGYNLLVPTLWLMNPYQEFTSKVDTFHVSFVHFTYFQILTMIFYIENVVLPWFLSDIFTWIMFLSTSNENLFITITQNNQLYIDSQSVLANSFHNMAVFTKKVFSRQKLGVFWKIVSYF